MYLDCNGFDGVSQQSEVGWRRGNPMAATLALHVKCANKVFLHSPSFSGSILDLLFKKALETKDHGLNINTKIAGKFMQLVQTVTRAFPITMVQLEKQEEI